MEHPLSVRLLGQEVVKQYQGEVVTWEKAGITGSSRTITGFYAYGSPYFNVTNGDDVLLTDFHFQSNKLEGYGLPTTGGAGALIMRNNPGGFVRGTNAYIETHLPDDVDWSPLHDINQCAFQVRHISSTPPERGCPNSDMSGVVVDGCWDGCKTPYSPGTKYHHCAFFRSRDDVVEYDTGLQNFGDSYIWEDNLVVGFRQAFSTRPGAGAMPPGGHVITVNRSIFAAWQSLNVGASATDPYSTGIVRKTRGDVRHDFTDCVFAYDEAPTQGTPESHVASLISAGATANDTVTNCTFVWLGAGSVPTKFGLDNHPSGWTIISGAGPHDHLGVTGDDALDWFENYIVAWLNQAGERFTNLRTTILAKVDWSRVVSGNDRHVMLPNMSTKLGAAPPVADALLVGESADVLLVGDGTDRLMI